MISVIIPVYNASEFVEEAVQSTLIQPAVSEVLIIEDGSTDGSLQICERLVSENEIIKLLRHPNGANQGAGTSRNLGIQHAKNEWIAFLDADDYYLQDRFKVQIDIINSNPNLAVLYSGVIYYDPDGKKNVNYPSENLHFGLLNGGGVLGTTPSNLWSKQHLDSVGGFNTKLTSSQEYDLLFRLFKQHYVFKLDNSFPKTVVRQHKGERISNQSGIILGENWINLRREIITFITPSKINLSDAEAEKLMSNLIGILYQMKTSKKRNEIYTEFYKLLFSSRNKNLNFKLRFRHVMYSVLGYNASELFFDKLRWITRIFRFQLSSLF